MSACRAHAPLKLDDIKYANVVVVGRIVDYEIVLNQVARQERKKEIERSSFNNYPPEIRKMLSEQKKFSSDYARFNVLVDEVLVGEAANIITVTWNNSTFGEPDKIEAGKYIIGLRESGSKKPPLRGPSATVLASQEPKLLKLLQAPCAPAFMFDINSAEAGDIRVLLGSTDIKVND